MTAASTIQQKSPRARTKRVRARSRRGERGAAMTEAVVAIPFFLIIFAGIMFVGKMYETKMRVMRLSKESAWNYAMCNCGNAGDPGTSKCNKGDGPGAGSGGESGGSPDGFDPSSIDKAGKGPGADIATKKFGSSVASMSLPVTADGFLGGYTKNMTSHTQVMCNEAPHNASIKGWGSAAFDALTKW